MPLNRESVTNAGIEQVAALRNWVHPVLRDQLEIGLDAEYLSGFRAASSESLNPHIDYAAISRDEAERIINFRGSLERHEADFTDERWLVRVLYTQLFGIQGTGPAAVDTIGGLLSHTYNAQRTAVAAAFINQYPAITSGTELEAVDQIRNATNGDIIRQSDELRRLSILGRDVNLGLAPVTDFLQILVPRGGVAVTSEYILASAPDLSRAIKLLKLQAALQEQLSAPVSDPDVIREFGLTENTSKLEALGVFWKEAGNFLQAESDYSEAIKKLLCIYKSPDFSFLFAAPSVNSYLELRQSGL